MAAVPKCLGPLCHLLLLSFSLSYSPLLSLLKELGTPLSTWLLLCPTCVYYFTMTTCETFCILYRPSNVSISTSITVILLLMLSMLCFTTDHVLHLAALSRLVSLCGTRASHSMQRASMQREAFVKVQARYSSRGPEHHTVIMAPRITGNGRR